MKPSEPRTEISKQGHLVETVEFDGLTYRRYPNAKHSSAKNYFTRSGGSLHRAVWEFYHGPIPAFHEIHHIDRNPQNNSIENLLCMDRKTHLDYHAANWTESHRQNASASIAKHRHLAYQWHQTQEGIDCHIENGRKQWHACKTREFACQQCGEKFKSKSYVKEVKHCSRKCQVDYYKKIGYGTEQRTCDECQSQFVTNKYFPTRCCGISCSRKLEVKLRHAGLNYDGTPRDKPWKGKVRRKICGFCGEVFERPSNTPENKFCGRNCGVHAKMIDNDKWDYVPCRDCGEMFQQTRSRPLKQCKECLATSKPSDANNGLQ